LANHESAAKAARQAERRKQRNRSIKSAVKTQLRSAERLVASDEDSAEGVKASIAALDRAAKKGVLHPNNVARHKSRLMKKVNAAAS
jgi:small subunit ribosomal protein S20